MKKKKTSKKPSGQKLLEQKLASARAAQAGFHALPISALVATISIMIDVLHQRGVEIVDFDDRDKVLHSIKIIGNKVFMLAPRKKPGQQEVTNNESATAHE